MNNNTNNVRTRVLNAASFVRPFIFRKMNLFLNIMDKN